MTPNIVELTKENFEQLLTVESFQRPILIDFWADWCAPCKMLLPILERLVNEFDGQFVLAKLDTEAEPELAAQFGVRNLPTVAIIQDGKPVDHFSGALPESEVKTFLQKYLPKPWDELLNQAELLMAEGRHLEALPLAKQAFELSEKQPDIAKVYIQILITGKRVDEAELVMSEIAFKDQDKLYHSLAAQIELAKDAAEAPEIQELQDRLQKSPDDASIKYELALQYHQNSNTREALQLLLEVLTFDINYAEGSVKKSMLEMIKSLSSGDPLATEFQKKLFTLLY